MLMAVRSFSYDIPGHHICAAGMDPGGRHGTHILNLPYIAIPLGEIYLRIDGIGVYIPP